MTPLAHRIVRELTLPLKERTFDDRNGLLRQMADVHCFECSDAKELARELKIQIVKGGIDERSTFLPAPKTWLEWRDERGHRSGVLLVAEHRELEADQYWAFGGYGDFGSYRHPSKLRLQYPAADLAFPKRFELRKELAELHDSDEELLALLAIINTPHVMGRRQHQPHRGLQRQLLARQQAVGKFPLHAWTEIKLEVTPPYDASADGTHETHLTGKKALHFCRAHLRIAYGKLISVRAHWRGDGALGIKRSRYKVAG